MIKNKILKIKKGKLEIWKAWCLELQNERIGEARETLLDEGLEYETVGIFQIKDDHYILASTSGEERPTDLGREINKTHREKRKECLDFVDEVEVLYYITP